MSCQQKSEAEKKFYDSFTCTANSLLVSKEIRQLQLINMLQTYILFLGEELDELAVLANNRGWKSKRVKKGEELREEINKQKKLLSNGKHETQNNIKDKRRSRDFCQCFVESKRTE